MRSICEEMEEKIRKGEMEKYEKIEKRVKTLVEENNGLKCII